MISEADGSLPTQLEQAHRRELLSLLTEKVRFGEHSGPLLATLPRYIASFYRLLVREGDQLTVPTF